MFAAIALLFSVTAILADNVPVVNIPLGLIEGTIAKSVKGRDFFTFKGIPFAKPPVGKYRFAESVPPKPWIGTWKANHSYICLQYKHFYVPGESRIEGEEDCLYLNVFTPTLDPNANLDVLVYIHGGAFMFNHGSIYGPEILMDKDIVQVNINYRLGPFGFLSTEDALVPGNNGIKDQILALKWVNHYIKYFGGNPKSITISGMSAGGASVHSHYLIPQSKGLFHKGISQSGVALNPWVLMENPLQQTKKLASIVGCPTDFTKNIVDCLKKRPSRKIVSSMSHFQHWLYNPFSPFGMVVDSWDKNPLLPDHPYILLKKQQVLDLPWISSYTSAEGLYPGSDFYSKDEYLHHIDTKWNEIIPHILHYNFTVNREQLDEISQKIRKEYLGNGKVTRSTFSKLIQLIGDRLFLVDIEKAIRLHAAAVKSQIYSYKFSHRGANSASDFRSGSKDNLGASHADDTSYVFKTSVNTLTTPEDIKVSNVLVDIFVTFMRTGKPMIPNTTWEPVPKNPTEPFRQLHIEDSENIKMESIPSFSNRQFWDNIPFKENEKLFLGKDEL